MPIRYFGAFNDEVLAGFWKSFSNAEILAILEDESLKGSSPTPGFSDASAGLVYHMLASPTLVRDSRVLSLLHGRLPKTTLLSFPNDYPPPGLLLLLMDEIAEVREWASRQVSLYESVPMGKEDFGQMYITVLELATRTIKCESRGSKPNDVTTQPQVQGNTTEIFPFVRSLTVLWVGYRQLLRFVPPVLLKPDPSFGLDLRQVVVGHLHDTELR